MLGRLPGLVCRPMDGETMKTWGAVLSPLVAAGALAWAIWSWRRAGSRLRIHALLYQEVLVLWIFNSGRTTDKVERIVLGGRRGGIDGHELTKELKAPIVLAPGESWRDTVHWRSSVPEDRHGALLGGWESLWLLLGSMQQRRAEVTVLPQNYPPRVGWRLAPRGTWVTRYLPAASLLPLLAVESAAAESEAYGAVALSGLWLLVSIRAVLAQSRDSLRRRSERWAVAVIAAVATSIWFAKADLTGSGAMAWLNGVLYVVAGALAWPGILSSAHRWGRSVRDRFRGQSRQRTGGR